MCFADNNQDNTASSEMSAELVSSNEKNNLADSENEAEEASALDENKKPLLCANSNRQHSYLRSEDIASLGLTDIGFSKVHSFSIGNVLPQSGATKAEKTQTMTEEEFKQGTCNFFDRLQYLQDSKESSSAYGEYLQKKLLQVNKPLESSNDAPEVLLSDSQAQQIDTAVKNLEDNGYSYGYLILDLDTGNTIYSNIDEKIYGASTFKGPFVKYVCQNLIDKGVVSLDSVKGQIEAVVLYSDNDTYRSLRYAYDATGFAEYLDYLGLNSSELMVGGSFPAYSVRTSAVLWFDIYQYLFTRFDNETAMWLSDLYANTEYSPLRQGVHEVQEQAVVFDKAGWISGDENCVCDAGLVEFGNKTYLISIMTNQPDCEESFERVANLAAALMNAAPALDPEAYNVG